MSSKLISCRIDANPDYYLCWYENEPENLKSYIPAARAGKPVRIGDYVQQYRDYFESCDPADYMIDVGANIGLSAFPVASVNHRVVCFEPAPVNVELLQQGITKNEFENIIRLEARALSDKETTFDLFVPDNRADNASTDSVCSNMNVNKNNVHQVPVAASSFDNWWAEHSDQYPVEHARLFKIDTQGHELSVLKGAEKFLSSAVKYHNLFMELEWDSGFLKQRGIDGIDILNYIYRLGYEIVAPVSLEPSLFSRFSNTFIRSDLVCRPRR